MSTLDSPGGIVSSHPAADPFPILLAPSLGKEKNTIRSGLIPVACWKLNDVRFAFGSSFVLPESRPEFAELAALRKEHPGSPLSIFGHADPVGDDNFNKSLSGNRAEAIYAVLVRDVAMWETLYTTTGSAEGWGQPSIQVMVNALGHPNVASFQSTAGLNPDGVAGPMTRAKLFPAYMDFLCPEKLNKSEFLSGGQDAKGKGDYQGCSEFNPAMVFSKAEDGSLGKPERDSENRVNRRVMALLFRAGSIVPPAKWPCPRSNEGADGCRKRFWSDGEKRRAPGASRREFAQTKDTFACRFYHRLVERSPCEGIDPVPVLDEVGPLLDQVTGSDAVAAVESGPTETESSNFAATESAVKAKPASAPAAAAAEGDTPGLTDPDFGFVMVRKDKSVARQIFRFGVDKPFDGIGTLTVAPAGKIEFFVLGGGGKALTFNGDNTFPGADLSKPGGVIVAAEGIEASKSKKDITLTLTLSGGTKKVKPPAKLKLTSVELTLDIAHPPAAGKNPEPLPMPDKQTKGARVFRQGDPPLARRAVLTVRPTKPANLNHDLLLHTLSGRIDIFTQQTPAKGQAPTSGVITVPSASIPATGKQFFVEGKFASKHPAEETIHIGIQTNVHGTILNDHVGVTVVEQNWTGKLFYNRTWSHDTGQADAAVKEFLPNNKVELHGKAPGASKDVLVAASALDKDGKFEFLNVPELDSAFIRIFLEHKDSKVVVMKGRRRNGSATPINEADFKIRAGSVVSFDHKLDPALFKGKSGDLDFNNVEVTQATFIKFCDAYVSIVFGHTRLLELTKNAADAKLCQVFVPQDSKEGTTQAGGEEMFILESDVQDRDVILHEYGHFITDTIVGQLEYLGYTYNDAPGNATHSPSDFTPHGAEHYESAWLEGHATFISCALRDKPTYKDSHEGPADTDPSPTQNLMDVNPFWGAHNEAPVQEVLWNILKLQNIPFDKGFFPAYNDKTTTTIYSFFDNWKAKGLPDIAKVVTAFKSRGMEFGYRFPAGADMFTAVAAPKTFDAAKKEFRTVDELFNAFGKVPGDTAGTKADYEMEFYNRNKSRNAGALGAGSNAAVDASGNLVITIRITAGKKYIVPRRFQIKP
ncbi:MAG: OmpA family protein [Acidobacteria bacterium]|nr:OmpA family protein [Acidobacteriota bacterium]